MLLRRDRFAITPTIGSVQAIIARQVDLLTSGESAEQIGDAPAALEQAARGLTGFARERGPYGPPQRRPSK